MKSSNPRKSVHQQTLSSKAMNSRHFGAIIHHETIKQKKLPIPERYGDELSETISITVGGREWSFGIERSGASVWLGSGWPEFAAFYSLHHGNTLFFKCKGVRCFDVHIFGRSACEIDYTEDDDSSVEILGGSSPSHRENLVSQVKRTTEAVTFGAVDVDGGDSRPGQSRKGKSKLKTKCDDDDQYEPVEILGGSSPSHRENLVSQDKQNEPRRSKRTTEAVDVDGGDSRPGQSRKGKSKCDDDDDQYEPAYLTALGAAENPMEAAKMFKPAGHSFTMVVKPYHLHGQGGYIPLSFANHLQCSNSVYLHVQVSGGSEHCVRAVYRGAPTRGLNLSIGFHFFVTENNLKEGDVIVFELIEPESVKLKATIFRASSFRHGQRLTKNQGRPSSSGTKKSGKKKVEKPLGKASVSDEPECEDTKVYYSYRFPKSVKNASAATKRAVKAAQELKSENPSFLLILNASAFTNKRLYVPAEFWAIYLSKDFSIEVQDSDGRQWFFRSIHELKGGSYLCGGWNDFVANNNLKQGDVCVFQLIKSTKKVLKVSVFHAEE